MYEERLDLLIDSFDRQGFSGPSPAFCRHERIYLETLEKLIPLETDPTIKNDHERAARDTRTIIAQDCQGL